MQNWKVPSEHESIKHATQFLCNFLYVMLGKGPKAYSKAPNKARKEKLSRERDKIKFVDVRFENRQVLWI